MAHLSALARRSQVTVWETLPWAGSFSSRLPVAGQCAEDHSGLSSPVSVIVSTAVLGPRSTLQSALEVFSALRTSFGFWSGS